MDLPKFIRLVADIMEGLEETKSALPATQQEMLVCMHCHHILKLDGTACGMTTFVPRQVLNPISMQGYFTPWKYQCGKCRLWGFEFSIDEVNPSVPTTN